MNQKVLQSFSEQNRDQASVSLKSNRRLGKSELSLDRQKLVGDFLERLGRFTPIDVGLAISRKTEPNQVFS